MEKTQSVLLLVLLLCVVSTCWGQQGNPVIMIGIVVVGMSYELGCNNVNLVSLNSVPDSGIWS